MDMSRPRIPGNACNQQIITPAGPLARVRLTSKPPSYESPELLALHCAARGGAAGRHALPRGNSSSPCRSCERGGKVIIPTPVRLALACRRTGQAGFPDNDVRGAATSRPLSARATPTSPRRASPPAARKPVCPLIGVGNTDAMGLVEDGLMAWSYRSRSRLDGVRPVGCAGL